MNKKLGRLLYPQTWAYFVVMALFALTAFLTEQYIVGFVEAVVTFICFPCRRGYPRPWGPGIFGR